MPRTPAQPADADAEVPGTDVCDLDLAVIVGTLSSDPVHQDLPSGSRLVRYEVTVRDRTPADTVPVTWFDPARPPKLAEGDRVVVVGRVRRRFFRAGGATRSATEVVATSVCRPRSPAAAEAAVAEAAAVLAALPGGDRR
jgi:single-strand DNA-binding protein